MTNTEFAQRVIDAGADCSPSMASRLRNGERKPSIKLAHTIAVAFDFTPTQREDFFVSIWEGEEACGEFLRANVFGVKS